MNLKLFNTYGRRMEQFKPLKPGEVGMYNCGPTVYSSPHIGNFRAFICADVLRRYFEYHGLTVKQVMNITDVGHIVEDADTGEDKLQQAARREKKDPWQIAAHYTQMFLDFIGTLNLRKAAVYPKATEHIPEMIAMVQKLIEKGHAYVANGSVYYDISTFPNYGKLSGNTLEQLQAGARIEVNTEKKNPLDFALWKTDPKHVMQWESPWSRGFPGWHIECSAMSLKYLGNTFDIHTGGEDNIFPHHECEIAQAEGTTGQKCVNTWLHTRHLLVDGQKMSKSLGNFYTVQDILDKGFGPKVLRYALLSTHYRQPLNFTIEGLDAAKNSLQRLTDCKRRLREARGNGTDPQALTAADFARRKFEAAMDDDLNISEALAAVFDFVRDSNKCELTRDNATILMAQLDAFDMILGVLSDDAEEVPMEITALVEQREQARKSRDFAAADAVRKLLKERGWVLEDTPAGPRVKPAK
jgi:cysteinyl-tRNA synthetase